MERTDSREREREGGERDRQIGRQTETERDREVPLSNYFDIRLTGI
jgi:hypothetical protein